MRNKIFLIFILIGCIFLNACSAPEHYEVRKDLSVYFSNADTVIAAVRNSLRKHDTKIIINYTSHSDNMQDIGTLVRELMQYALAETENPEEGDYIFHQYGGYEMQYRYEIQNQDYCYEIEIIPDYYTTPEQEREVSQQIQEIIRNLDFRKTTSEYEKIRKIYQYVYDTVDYDLIHKKNNYYHLKSTAYGALKYHHAVC
ncbi:MAG: transglutaminase domain-containing protein [Oscillospiraceae bacterium]|nr:transglutaminase domain-containing protein [Oscillospiraceae bacterium]